MPLHSNTLPLKGEGDEELPPEDVDVVLNFYIHRHHRGSSATDAHKQHQEQQLHNNKNSNPNTTKSSPLTSPPSSSSSSSPPPPPSSPRPHTTVPSQQQEQQYAGKLHALKDQLVAALASLDRGLAATNNDITKVENLVTQLEIAGGPVILSLADPKGRNTMDLINGRWKLLYSSGFSGGNLGGLRPGPPAALLPLTLGAIYQDIFVNTSELDNVVTFTSKLSLAPLISGTESPSVTARLKHSFSIQNANTVRIVFENTVVKTQGGVGGWLSNLPQFSTPQLPEAIRSISPLADARGATFDVSYLDATMRVTRGDRGELRVFLKDD